MRVARLTAIFLSLLVLTMFAVAQPASQDAWNSLPKVAQERIAATVFRRHPAATWAQPNSQASAPKQDWFGISIAISGNTVVVGAFDSNIEGCGSAAGGVCVCVRVRGRIVSVRD